MQSSPVQPSFALAVSEPDAESSEDMELTEAPVPPLPSGPSVSSGTHSPSVDGNSLNSSPIPCNSTTLQVLPDATGHSAQTFGCPICVEDTILTETCIRCPNGNHFLHAHCFEQAIRQDSRCPVCRVDWHDTRPLQHLLVLEIPYRRPSVDWDPLLVSDDWATIDAVSLPGSPNSYDIINQEDMTPENGLGRDSPSIASQPVSVLTPTELASPIRWQSLDEGNVTPFPPVPPPVVSVTQVGLTAPRFPDRLVHRLRPAPYLTRASTGLARVSEHPPSRVSNLPFHVAPQSMALPRPNIASIRSNLVSLRPHGVRPQDGVTSASSSLHHSSRELAWLGPRRSRLSHIPQTSSSSRDEDALALGKLVDLWMPLLRPFFHLSVVLAEVSNPETLITQALKSSSSGTLRRHLSSWKLFVKHLSSTQTSPFSFSHQLLLDFFQTLHSSRIMDRGSRQAKADKVNGPLAAIRFVSRLLSLPALSDILSQPWVLAWTRQDTDHKQLLKEAVPVPVTIIAKFELALLGYKDVHLPDFDYCLVVGFLLMLWGGLRFSDLQRSLTKEFSSNDSIVRWLIYRTKSSASGMPAGVFCAGIYAPWDFHVMRALDLSSAEDFFWLSPAGTPASYAFI
jgi:hypothetical protein